LSSIAYVLFGSFSCSPPKKNNEGQKPSLHDFSCQFSQKALNRATVCITATSQRHCHHKLQFILTVTVRKYCVENIEHDRAVFFMKHWLASYSGYSYRTYGVRPMPSGPRAITSTTYVYLILRLARCKLLPPSAKQATRETSLSRQLNLPIYCAAYGISVACNLDDVRYLWMPGLAYSVYLYSLQFYTVSQKRSNFETV